MTDKGWRRELSERTTTVVKAFRNIKSGDAVFIGSGCGRPGLLYDGLLKLRGPIGDLEILHGMTLGVIDSTAPAHKERFRHNAFFVDASTCTAVDEGRADYTPVFSSELPGLFKSGRMPVDVALLQVRPPNESGFCCLGISVGITKPALEGARFVAAELNPNMPLTFGNTMVPVSAIDAFVETERPLTEVESPEIDQRSREIAHHCVSLIEDGATLRMGLSAVTAAVVEELIRVGRRDLGIHTETFTEPMMALMESGVATNARKQLYPGKSLTCRCLGTRKLYDFVHNNPQVEFHTTTEVCDPFRIARQDRMVAIIRAVQVDLTGQVADGTINAGFMGGFGGRSDFLHGAAGSPRGKPIVVLPSTTPDGKQSNIKMFLDRGAAVITSGAEAHFVVTEWGVAALHGRTIRERAVALIAIAHPKFREELMEQAKEYCYVYQDQLLPFPDEAVYPEHMETEVGLTEWTKIALRPARPADERVVQDFIYSLGDSSIHYRFHGQMHRMCHSRVQHFVNVDYKDTLTILAFLADGAEHPRMIGMGQYLRYPDVNRAEVAFITHDDFHNKGVGTVILSGLTRYARQQGLEGFFAEVLQGNHAMLRVFQKSGLNQRTSFDDGVYTVEMDL